MINVNVTDTVISAIDYVTNPANTTATQFNGTFDIFNLGIDVKPLEVGDPAVNAEYAQIAIILLGVAAGNMGISTASLNWTKWTSYLTSILSYGGVLMYVWAMLAWLQSSKAPSAETTFVSWRVNFINFWVAAGLAALNIIMAIVAESSNLGWVI